MNKVLYWLSARPLFDHIGKGYRALRTALDNIPGFDVYHNLATKITDVIFGIVKLPQGLEQRFEPYLEPAHGRSMDRSLTFLVLAYMAALGAYPSSLGHLDTAPQIWVALPIVSGFNPYLGLVSGVVFSVFDWVGKFLPFESVYGADFGSGMQNFWGARIGYIFAYSTMILNGLLPGVLARVFRQLVRKIASQILPSAAARAAVLALLTAGAGTLVYHVAGPDGVMMVSAVGIMAIGMAVQGPQGDWGPPSPCLTCGTMLPAGQYQCMSCGGLNQSGQDYMDAKNEAERRAREMGHHQPHPPPGQPPGPYPPGMSPGPYPPGVGPGPTPPAPGGQDPWVEALATVGSILGATTGIVASHEWAQRVGNYTAFIALRADADLSCRAASEGNYSSLQAKAPLTGAGAGVMPPGAAGAVSGGGSGLPPTAPPWLKDHKPPRPGDHVWVEEVRDGVTHTVPYVHDPATGGWRSPRDGEGDLDGQVWDAQRNTWQDAGGVAWDNRVAQDTRNMQERERQKVADRRDRVHEDVAQKQAREKTLSDKQQDYRDKVQAKWDAAGGKDAYAQGLKEGMESAKENADWWTQQTGRLEGGKWVIDTGVNMLANATGPVGQVIGRTYTVVSTAAESGTSGYLSGGMSGAVKGTIYGTLKGGATAAFQDVVGGVMNKGGQMLKAGFTGLKGAVPSLTSGLKNVGGGFMNTLTSPIRAIHSGGMGGYFGGMANGLKASLKGGARGITQGIQSVGKGLSQLGGSGARGIGQTLSSTGKSVVSGIQSGAKGISDTFTMFSNPKSFFKPLQTIAKSGGGAGNLPITQALKSFPKALVKRFFVGGGSGEVATQASNTVESFLFPGTGVGSPTSVSAAPDVPQ